MTTSLLMLVVGSMLGNFMTIQRAAARQVSRSELTDQLRLTMDRITKDVRQATSVHPASSSSYLEFDTFIDGSEHRVAYDGSSGTTVTRSVDGGTPITLLERLQTTAIFTYAPDVTDASVITVTLIAKPDKFEEDGSDVTLTSEVRRRNR